MKKGTGCFSLKSSLSLFLFLVLVLSGCTPATYSGKRLKEAIIEIARKEYGITEGDVQMSGTTLGVFLPLKQLFATDFKEALLSGKVTNMEQLFQPTEEALDKVEDMLFSMSRVMLSTDRKIDFYYLQATDVEKTGMELSFLGNIDDVKKVRFWDIPRSEYRKRVIHEIQLNRAALWHRPVREFFKDLNTKDRNAVQAEYFRHATESKWAEEFFFTDASGHLLKKSRAAWEILDMRSISVRDNEVVVYTKVHVTFGSTRAGAKTLEYLFQISTAEAKDKIRRIIPMLMMDQLGKSSALPLTRKLVYESLPQWETEFKTPDVTMGSFLSLQLTRRLQQNVADDERVYNTLSNVKLIFQYDDQDKKHFIFTATAPLKDSVKKVYSGTGGIQEDVLYVLEMAAREFVDVVHSYNFRDWEYLELNLTQVPGYSWRLSRENAELLRKKKKPFQDLIELIRD